MVKTGSDLAKFIKSERIRQDMKPARLSVLSGIHPSNVSLIENGKRPLGELSANRLLHPLGFIAVQAYVVYRDTSWVHDRKENQSVEYTEVTGILDCPS